MNSKYNQPVSDGEEGRRKRKRTMDLKKGGKSENQRCLLRSLKCQGGRTLGDLHTQFT